MMRLPSSIALLMAAWLSIGSVPLAAAQADPQHSAAEFAREIRPSLVLLPLQDRVGDPQVAALISATLQEALAELAATREPSAGRDMMRRLRVRNALDAPPAALNQLFRQLDTEWLFVPVLHTASAGIVPQVALSAVVLKRSESEVAWAGFSSTSGLEQRQVLSRGIETELEQICRRAARELVEDFARQALIAGHGRCDIRRNGKAGGYLRQPLTSERLGLVAVLPFDAATGVQAAIHAEMATALARAELYRHGVRLALPALVNETMRQKRNLTPGEVPADTRLTLQSSHGVRHILTGMVETFRNQGGIEPRPEVAFGLRLLAAETGQILWMDGIHEQGWQHQRLFQTRRIYAGGRLAESLIHTLISGAVTTPETQAPNKGPQS